MTADQKKRVRTLARQLLSDSPKPWDEIDQLVFDLYGLSPHDIIAVRDTVRFGSPYRSAREPAARPPTQSDCDQFCSYLEEMLQPFVKGVSKQLHVESIPPHPDAWDPSWRFIKLAARNTAIDTSTALLSKIMREANRTAASRVIMVLPQGGLLIGLLNQLRFWSQSRARLCGLHIVRQHLGAFRLK